MGEFRLGNTAINQYFLADDRIGEQVLPLYPDYLTYVKAGEPNSYPGSGSDWFDITVANNDATLVNSPTFTSASISYFEFASTKYADLGNMITSSALNPTKEFQVMGWVYLSSYPSDKGVIASKWDGPNNQTYRLYITSSGECVIETSNSSSVNDTIGETIPLNTWTLVGSTYNGVAQGVGINDSGNSGSSAEPSASFYVDSGRNDRIGNDYDDNFFPGRIGEVRFLSESVLRSTVFEETRGYYGV